MIIRSIWNFRPEVREGQEEVASSSPRSIWFIGKDARISLEQVDITVVVPTGHDLVRCSLLYYFYFYLMSDYTLP